MRGKTYGNWKSKSKLFVRLESEYLKWNRHTTKSKVIWLELVTLADPQQRTMKNYSKGISTPGCNQYRGRRQLSLKMSSQNEMKKDKQNSLLNRELIDSTNGRILLGKLNY